MAYLSDDELLDTEGGFTGWDDGTGAGAEETLEQALAEERLAELESELEQDEHPIDYEAELEDEEEEAAPVSDKRLKREMRAEAIRRLEEAARTESSVPFCFSAYMTHAAKSISAAQIKNTARIFSANLSFEDALSKSIVFSFRGPSSRLFRVNYSTAFRT
mgnify:CR=1 FL=1